MSRKNILVSVIVIMVALVIWAVIPDREEQALAEHQAAFEVEQAGNLDKAIALYEALIKEYEETVAATRAAQSIERINKLKERKAIQEVQKNLGRILLVLNGYNEMTGQSPRSLSDLDDGSYMFDSEYVAGIVPEGFTYYLRFEKDGSYTMYSHKEGADQVVKRFGSNNVAVVPLAKFEKEIAVDGFTRKEFGRLIVFEAAGSSG
ncbi:MAG: hypothetical protein C0623_07955 [Desulfuromonas sp.]|nr:MAG: hypothetical protein C0623_07955 [Desulfuromonas sp.]